MSVFPDPNYNTVNLRTSCPIRVSDHVYEFTLLSDGQDYVYNIIFHTHPLLLDRSGDFDRYRLSTADVDYIQFIVDGQVVSTIPNICRDEPILQRFQMGGIYSAVADFFNNNPIIAGLLNNDAVLRVVFWREPVAPFWITYNNASANLTYPTHNFNRWIQPTVRSYNGSYLTYAHGSLR